MTKRLFIIFVMVAVGLATETNARQLRIMAENSAPVNFVKDGKWQGATAEVVMEIMRRLGLPNTIEEMPWARGYKMALEQPDIVLFSMARTPEREKRFHWVGPVSVFRSDFYARKDSNLVIRSLDDARQVGRIGTYRDDVREDYLAKKGFTNLDSTNSNLSNLRKLIDGRIDLWATSNTEAVSVTEQHDIAPSAIRHVYSFQKFVLYIAISKQTSKAVARAWQSQLDAMKADGSFWALSRPWLPPDSLPEEVIRPARPEEERKPIAIYTENAPPGNYIEDGQLKGPAVRVVQEILRRLSLDTTIELVPWARGYHMVLTRPNVALFSTSRLPQREKVFKWVGPLYTQRWGFYARKAADLPVQTIADAKAVARIGTYHEDAKEQYLQSLGFTNLVSTNNNIGNVRHLMEGRIDLWVSSDFNMPNIVRYAGYDPRQLKLVLSFKTIGNYIAFSLTTPDHVVASWQRVLDDIRRDGTWRKHFADYLTVAQ